MTPIDSAPCTMFALPTHRRNPRPGCAAACGWGWRIAIAALIASATGIARAGTIYEFRACDGPVEYAQQAPEHDCGAPVRRFPWHAAVVFPAPANVDVASAAEAGAVTSTDPSARVAHARLELRRAIAAQRNGQEPLPGERQHLVNGHSRLRQAYFDRLRSLQAAVDHARRVLDAALRSGDRSG